MSTGNNMGAVPIVIIQDTMTGKILMVGHMDKYAYAKTLQLNKVVLYHLSAQQTYVVGESCGHELLIQNFHINHHQPYIIIEVISSGTSCGYCNPYPFALAELKISN